MTKTSRLALAALSLAFVSADAYAADASENWTKLCAKCHAADGSGNTKIGRRNQLKDYTKKEVQDKLTDADMLKATLDGVTDDAGKEKMPAYKEKISEQEAKDLVAYIRGMAKAEPAPKS